jgi:hypothetical protein
MRSAIREFIAQSTRPLEAAFLLALEDPAAAEPFLNELATYQNADGGFGNALEPDLRPPESSALVTTVAFQYLTEANVAADHPLVASGLPYFDATYQSNKQGWNPIAETTADHPSAPWWDYQASLTSPQWGNPSAEVLASLMRFGGPQNQTQIEALSKRSVVRINEITDPEFHELLCFGRLYEQAGADLQAALWPALSKLIVIATETDPLKWTGYQATPLSFVKSPESPFAPLFAPQLIEADLCRLVAEAVDGSHWPPAWSWEEAHPAAWQVAKADWTAVLTCQNLQILESRVTQISKAPAS